jgi:hypothetical protein
MMHGRSANSRFSTSTCAVHRYFHAHGASTSHFSINIARTGSHVPWYRLFSGSCCLYAGDRILGNQGFCMLNMVFQPSTTFDLTVQCFDTPSTVHFRSSPKDLPGRMIFCLFPQRSPPRLLISAAWGGLRSAPESRPRGAFPHRYHSCELTSL